MLKKLLLVIVSLWIMVAPVRADVDVNKADQAALDGVRGIGPAMSKRILTERDRGGSFKDWGDLQQRVKGIKQKSAEKLSGNGLTVNGQALGGRSDRPGKSGRPGARTAPAETKVASGETAPATAERNRK
ncbi:helix-hairpin-helix domain-containing protein [Herbaspirillum sp. YR522]|uniref:ComEA family DNA-binding protein n=1 Tax=Herbaspirillum sp. YR522 TaxID=1144342 RepID=UPI00026F5C6C|nr:helix-hairpin-helix domain-containing protein [Herbaspirillum sp. YR522]EJN07301.1 hypothetical protein PMI40_01928 [Herbaspirillum sp. YR522]